MKGARAEVGCALGGALSLVAIFLLFATPHRSPWQQAAYRGLLGVVMIVGLLLFLAGAWAFRAGLRDYRARHRILLLVGRARQLDATVAPGEIVRFVGRVAGGAVQPAQSTSGQTVYGDHLLVEDTEGRSVQVGVPGRNEVFGHYGEGDLVLAVGELARRAGAEPFRSPDDTRVLTAGAHAVWVGIGDADGAAALQHLRAGFLGDVRLSALLFSLACLVWTVSLLLLRGA